MTVPVLLRGLAHLVSPSLYFEVDDMDSVEIAWSNGNAVPKSIQLASEFRPLLGPLPQRAFRVVRGGRKVPDEPGVVPTTDQISIALTK